MRQAIIRGPGKTVKDFTVFRLSLDVRAGKRRKAEGGG
jgi:hypothetical protein